ncbi:MAG: EAL domain-containing protein, partial [Acidaminococcaceae bacterium]
MNNNKKTILLVDDTVINRNILRKNFSGEYNILLAQDGVEALQILSQKFREIDLVLLDLVLPKLSGQDVLKHMQSDEKLKFIPVIAMTGIDNLEQAGKALDLGATEIFTKPLNITIMRQRIRNVMEMANREKSIKNVAEFVKWRASRYSEVITAKAICNVEFCVTKDEVSSISMNFVPDIAQQWETTWTEFLQHFIKEFVNTEYIPLAFRTFSRENLLENYQNGNNELQIDLIFSFADAEDLWGRTFAYLIDDADGNVYCNFYINDITEEKKAALALKQKVELDPVTTLYNRAYAETMINLSLSNTMFPGAFIILDIDNFKLVNDTMGHIYGDALLSEIGRRCKQFMSPGDVAGRYGGDEFIIYMAGIDKLQAKPKVDRLHSSLNVVFSQVTEFFNFSCSMGVAMFPDDGDNYLDLLSKADAALYYSKYQGKNKCSFYNDKMQWRASENVPVKEKTNENNEVGANFRENMFEYVFRILADVHELEKSIPMVFDLVGRSRAISRISLFILKSEGKYLRTYYEWNNRGVSVSNHETHNMTNAFMEKIKEDFEQDGSLTSADVTKLKSAELREWCSKRGALSLMMYKVFDEKGRIYAVVSFEQCDRKRHDSGKQNKFIGNLAMLVGVFFMKEARMTLLSEYYKIHKTLLNSTGTLVYVINKNNGDLLYCTDHRKKIFPSNTPMLKCYKELQKKDAPCENCPLKNQYGGKYNKPIFFENAEGKQCLEFVVEDSALYNNIKTATICMYDITERNKLQIKLKKELQEDELTGLFTRTYFFLETEQMLNANKGTDYVLFVLNIEHFKMINDLFGVDVGDNTLKFVAAKLKTMYGEKATIARLYADRFAVCIAKESFDAVEFMHIAAKEFNSFSYKFKIIVDIGIYTIDDISVPVRQMVDRAKIALQTVRGSYQNSFAYYDNAWREKLIMEHQLMADLEGALKTGEIVPYYQPYFDLKTRKILGAEALARWIHPKLGLVAPTLFIPIFERNGMIEQLDHYMWREACKFLANQMQQNNTTVPISVNISRVNFYNPNLGQNIIDLTEEYAVPPEMLRLEITESVYAQGKDIMFTTIKKLQEYGFQVLMDDFGSGYSSLNMLKDIKVDMLKIDMRFLGYCTDASRAYKILLAVADLGRRLEIPIIAEGIETREDTDKLRGMGID